MKKLKSLNEPNLGPIIGVLSIDRAIIELDCSKGFIYKLIRQGKLTPKKLGSKTYLQIEEIKNLVK